jgi:hypothetical protein
MATSTPTPPPRVATKKEEAIASCMLLLRMAVLAFNVTKRNGSFSQCELLKATQAIDALHASVIEVGGPIPQYTYVMDSATGLGYLQLLDD